MPFFIPTLNVCFPTISFGAITPAINVKNTDSKTKSAHHADWIVIAIGQHKFAEAISPKLKTNEKGRVIVDDTKQTSIQGLYSGGDCINGGKEVVHAVADGRNAAHAMLKSWNMHPVHSKIDIRSNGHG